MIAKIKIKIGKIIFSSFPLNSIRVLGLKLCGIEVGQNVYIGSGLIVTMPNKKSNCSLIIEDRVAIAPRVTFILESNANWSKLGELIKPIQGKVMVKHDSWIGTGSIVMPNTTIGEMAVVGAGSVVTKDVNAFSIVAGNPAKEIRKL
jgi:acetyltransferase-like isoleucine patch superfamily enzyme